MTPEEIIDRIAAAHHFTADDLRGPSRRAPIVRARHTAMYALREHTDLSYPKIGRLFNRHHTSVLHAVDRIEGARRINRTLDQLLDNVA